MSALTPTVVLTEDQIAFYHREGYLALDALTTQEEVAWLRDIYDRLFANRAGREVGDQFDLAGPDEEGQEAALPQILNPAKYAIFKPARTGAPTPWHQDEAYWNPAVEYNALSIWIPLQPATLENGCMQFVPGSHKQEVLTHHCINNDPRIHGLEVDSADTSTAVACPLPPGGATIHHNRTLHYTGPNRSEIPRRAYILAFGLPIKPRSEPRDFYWNTQKQTPREQRAAQARAAETHAASSKGN